MSMNMNEMLKRAKKMQEQAAIEEAEIAKKEFTVEKQGIKVVLLGTRKIKSIKFNEVLIDPDDPELLEDLTMLAINEAIELIDDEYAELNSKFSAPGF